MTLFVLISRYLKPMDQVGAVTPRHREWLDEHYRSVDDLSGVRTHQRCVPPAGSFVRRGGLSRSCPGLACQHTL